MLCLRFLIAAALFKLADFRSGTVLLKVYMSDCEIFLVHEADHAFRVCRA